ncbi:hypothetical protein RGU70_12615 [Herbaspirillum sp. RTI4]|uniref:hypothetical protein n=1 Tax=Herbaspirillum sp. RTI4 TaxID=3048640 RepID=UPI002AB42A99|nr:hypothetical protein [Herbaspirillum sp. RTI4]MDY7579164.1 hypothetical protein [Herbaspirillum sp. RTI4]MEA9981257.1 hypothetical protein [Herbaspirillum sp. RTI4]
MTIRYETDSVFFEDAISVDDAENLLQWLQENPQAKADFSACIHVHAANLQVLMAAHIQVTAWPRDDTLKIWLESAFGAKN